MAEMILDGLDRYQFVKFIGADLSAIAGLSTHHSSHSRGRPKRKETSKLFGWKDVRLNTQHLDCGSMVLE
jgi:hypothetical protein